MKDNIYNRIRQAETAISDQLNTCKKYTLAKDIDYKKIYERVMVPMQIKSMPRKYKEQISSILWFCFKREILNNYIFPVLWKGKLYSKWDAMPEDCKEVLRKANTEESLAMRPYPVFSWHFAEGMREYK